MKLTIPSARTYYMPKTMSVWLYLGSMKSGGGSTTHKAHLLPQRPRVEELFGHDSPELPSSFLIGKAEL